MSTLIKPPCCNTKNVPLENPQILDSLDRAERARRGFRTDKDNVAYIIAIQYYSQSAELIKSNDLEVIKKELNYAVWSTVHSGVGFDAAYETLLIEIDKQYTNIIIDAFNNSSAPRDNDDVANWLKQYNGKILRIEYQPVDMNDEEETIPSIVVLRQDNNKNMQIRISHSLTAYGFFDCPFEFGNSANSITLHINDLLEQKDERLLRKLQEDIGSRGTFKILCTDVKAKVNWNYFNWQPIDLATQVIFDTNELEDFIEITL